MNTHSTQRTVHSTHTHCIGRVDYNNIIIIIDITVQCKIQIQITFLYLHDFGLIARVWQMKA